MGMNAQREHYYTLEEYLQLEEFSNVKHEFIAGHIYVMMAARGPHNRICARLTQLIGQYGRKGCEAYSSQQLIYITAVDACYYPDLTIVCGPPTFHDEGQLLLTNPIAIFEVLSPSTAAFDRGTKLKHYQLIPSLRDYLIVSPDDPHIEHHERDPASGLWRPKEISGTESETLIKSSDCRLSLAELYG